MKSKVEYDLDERLIQSFMDIIALKLLKRNQSLSGYDLIRYFHRRHHMLLSSGTVYSLLYSLERQGLVEGEISGRRRVYKLTKNGEEYYNKTCIAKKRNETFFSSIFSED